MPWRLRENASVKKDETFTTSWKSPKVPAMGSIACNSTWVKSYHHLSVVEHLRGPCSQIRDRGVSHTTLDHRHIHRRQLTSFES